jgi:hypothetical protein
LEEILIGGNIDIAASLFQKEDVGIIGEMERKGKHSKVDNGGEREEEPTRPRGRGLL